MTQLQATVRNMICSKNPLLSGPLFILCFLAFSPLAEGQTFSAYMRSGNKALQQQDWYAALSYFRKALDQRSTHPEALFKAAEAARKYQSHEVSTNYYRELLDLPDFSDRNSFLPQVYYGLAESYLAQGAYQRALHALDSIPAPATAWQNRAGPLREKAQWALENIQHPLEVEIIHLDESVNSPWSDFAPLPMGDSLLYSSYRFPWKNDDHDPPRKLTRVVIADPDRSSPKPLRSRLNHPTRHTAHLTFAPNNQKVQYFTYCDFISSTRIQCQLYQRKKKERGRWSTPQPLPSPTNLEGYTQTHPCPTWLPDKNREVLLFVSDRPGGKGGMDIWMSIKDSTHFRSPQNLHTLNTRGDETSPWVDSHGHLYFSSNGRPGFGGLDIYRASHWWTDSLRVENMGHPLNSSYDDLYFTQKDSLTAYFASNRLGAFYLNEDNKTCCYDIYQAIFPPPPEPDTPVQVDIPPEPPAPTPWVLADFKPISLYFDNDHPSPNTRDTTTSVSYRESYLQFLDRQSFFEKAYEKAGKQEKARAAIRTFFQNEVKGSYEQLQQFSKDVLMSLEKGDSIEVVIKGFTSPRAKSNYNLYLSKRRVDCIRNHFETFQKGAFQPFLANGQLKIVTSARGEQDAKKEVSDALQDELNSIYSPAASRERRVEIQQVRRR